jgi:hypothetical protein
LDPQEKWRVLVCISLLISQVLSQALRWMSTAERTFTEFENGLEFQNDS